MSAIDILTGPHEAHVEDAESLKGTSFALTAVDAHEGVVVVHVILEGGDLETPFSVGFDITSREEAIALARSLTWAATVAFGDIARPADRLN